MRRRPLRAETCCAARRRAPARWRLGRRNLGRTTGLEPATPRTTTYGPAAGADRTRPRGAGDALRCSIARRASLIGTPETILRWYRELIAKKYDGAAGRKTGRPASSAEIQ